MMTGLIDTLWPYAAMVAMAFTAGTLLPLSSEVALAAAITSTAASSPGLVAAATIGNVVGSAFNWWAGRYARQLEGRRWFPIRQAEIDAAAARYHRFGAWSLLFSWLPFVGDPLTFVAGVLRVPLAVFLPLVTIGRLVRYVVVAAAV